MSTKCNNCGAPQQLNDLNTCIYCGDILKNEDLKEDLLKDFIPIKYEYSQENYSKVVKLADDYLKKDIYNIPCWCYKISSEFFHKSKNNTVYDFAILSNSLKSLLDLKITTSLSQKVIENQISYILDKIVIHHDIRIFRNYDYLESIINEKFDSEFSNYCKTNYTKYFKSSNGYHNEIFNPNDIDILFVDAAVLIISAQQGSTSLIQRRLKIGYNRAGRLMDQLESAGIVGPSQGSTPRNVIIKSNTELISQLTLLGIKADEKELPQVKITEPANSSKTSQSKTGCFIATATMGDYNHPVVMDLRHFRDNWLSKQSWGPSFVNWYYRNSPSAAKFIERNKYLRKVVFYILIKPLHLISKRMQ
jgi:hypothetical protein